MYFAFAMNASFASAPRSPLIACMPASEPALKASEPPRSLVANRTLLGCSASAYKEAYLDKEGRCDMTGLANSSFCRCRNIALFGHHAQTVCRATFIL